MLTKKWSKLYGIHYNDLAIEDSINNAAAVFVAELEGSIIGVVPVETGYWYGVKDKAAVESNFIVNPEYRSKGVCVELEKHIIEWAKADGCKSFYVTFSKPASNEFMMYAKSQEKRGYELHGVIMRKDLWAK